MLTALFTGTGCWMNYTHHPIPVAAADQIGIPHSWMLPLGTLLGAATLGLLAGLAIPPLGTATATALVLYFLGAILAHLRVHNHALAAPTASLTLSTATLTTTILYHHT
ncbi:DoxX family protein [Nocardia sp. NPDC004415]